MSINNHWHTFIYQERELHNNIFNKKKIWLYLNFTEKIMKFQDGGRPPSWIGVNMLKKLIRFMNIVETEADMNF